MLEVLLAGGGSLKKDLKSNDPVGLFQSFIRFSIRLSMFHNRYDFRSNQRCQVVGLVN